MRRPRSFIAAGTSTERTIVASSPHVAELCDLAGDTLVDFGQGLEIPLVWLPEGVTREQIAAGLHPLLALPFEHVLATHGGPSDRPALERALS